MSRISKLLEKFDKDKVIDRFLDNLSNNMPLDSGSVKFIKKNGFKGDVTSVDDLSDWIIGLDDKTFEDVYYNLS